MSKHKSRGNRIKAHPVDEVASYEVEIKTGVVTDCIKLNVRTEPNLKAEVLCELECLSRVVINEEESTDEFYKVYTSAGIEGFCMKKYIAVDF